MKFMCTLFLAIIVSLPIRSQVKMEKVKYDGWDNCIKLSNGKIELIATTDVGPRIIRCGFTGGQNLFYVFKDLEGKTGGKEWVNYGGHRLWHAPEEMPRTYSPDNSPVKYDWDGKTLTLIQKTEPETGIQKIIELTISPDENHVKVVHKLKNHLLWDVNLAVWGMSVMNQNGRAIFPQEPYKPHPQYLLPARALVLWHYTNMADPRFTWGQKYIQLRQDPSMKTKEKFGLMNKRGWAAYVLNDEVFIKKFPYMEGKDYPDFGCNNETYTDKDFLELETLSPMIEIKSNGGTATHVEDWYLYKAKVGDTDAEIDKTLLPLVEKSEVK